MTEIDVVRMEVHQKNIDRYRRLLRTKLTELERSYVVRRLAEERHALGLIQARRTNGSRARQAWRGMNEAKVRKELGVAFAA
jgi:hypothetical protein